MQTKLKAFLMLAQEQVARWDIRLEPAISNLRAVHPSHVSVHMKVYHILVVARMSLRPNLIRCGRGYYVISSYHLNITPRVWRLPGVCLSF